MATQPGLNAHGESLDFELPQRLDGNPWRRWIDTALESPEDIVPWECAREFPGGSSRAESRSVVMLYAPAEATK